MPTQLDLVKAVRSLVHTYPDATYPGFQKPSDELNDCMYGHGEATNGRIGCAIGQALVDMGIEINPAWDNLDNPDHGSISASTLCKYIWPDCSILSNISMWLDEFQSEQDNHKRWLEALQIADDHYPSVRSLE